MELGPTSGVSAADIAAGMSERIREAHDTAESEPVEQRDAQPAGSTDQSRPQVDQLGAELRVRLEEIVEQVIVPGTDEPDDLIGKVVEAVVDDRIDRSEMPGVGDYRHQLTEQLRNDPVVVAELDDIMQSIAHQLAARG